MLLIQQQEEDHYKQLLGTELPLNMEDNPTPQLANLSVKYFVPAEHGQERCPTRLAIPESHEQTMPIPMSQFLFPASIQ